MINDIKVLCLLASVVGCAFLGMGWKNEIANSARLQKDLDAATTQIAMTEAMRTIERATSGVQYNNLAVRCSDRVAAGVERGRTIEQAINQPPAVSGDRVMLGADWMRRVLGESPDPASATTSVPAVGVR